MKSLFFLVLSLLFSLHVFSQGVSINETGTPPDSSAMLDVSSQTKGFLLPRMNSLERIDISDPQTGLLVYDIDIQSLFYFDGGQWVEFASSRKGLRDSDFDTKVVVEQGMDDDSVRIFAKGIEKLKIHPAGLTYNSPEKNIFLGSGNYERSTHNLFLGHDITHNFFTGDSNVFVGNLTGNDLSTGHSRNTYLGVRAGVGVLRGSGNVFIGHRATSTDQGDDNISIGSETGKLGAISGSENIFIGKKAGGTHNGTMNKSIAIGSFAGRVFNGGIGNIFIGENAGSSGAEVNNCIFIGKNSGYAGLLLLPDATFNDLLFIDNQVTASPLILGDFVNDELAINGNLGVKIQSPQSELHIRHEDDADLGGLTIQNRNNNNYWRLYTRSANGNLRFYSTDGEGDSCGNNTGADDYVAWVSSCSGEWNSTSDLRKKKNFTKIQKVLPSIMDLDVLKYHFRSEEKTDKKHIGLIAQDVQKHFPELVNYDDAADLYTMQYDGFGPIALKGIQELKKENEALKAELLEQKKKLELLIKEVNKLKQF